METCACCGYQTIDAKGDYEICKICFWEDDPGQEADPWCAGGANKPSLFEAQTNFKKFGAMEQRFVSNTRSANSNDVKDPSWRVLTEEDKEYCSSVSEIEDVWGTKNAISYNYWERNA